MYKKILCPVDFSPASENGVEYAARMAAYSGGEIILMHSLSLPVLYSNAEDFAIMSSYNELRQQTESNLKKYCSEATGTFGIPCSYDIELSGIEFAGNSTAPEHDLIISGTNGADNIYQFYFGSKSYRISRNARVPTLIVPESCRFKEIRKLIYALEYSGEAQVAIHGLIEFAKCFNPEITVLHILKSEKKPDVSASLAVCTQLEAGLDGAGKVVNESEITDETAVCIERAMHNSQADVLAVRMEEHGFLYRLFHTNLIKKISSYADFPVLVFHQ